LGILGAVLLVVPALRDLSYREIVSLLRPERKPTSFGRAAEIAADMAEAEMLKFRPGDRRYIVGGLSAIALSYLLHMVAKILEHASVPA
jgi:hypothetical protein